MEDICIELEVYEMNASERFARYGMFMQIMS